MQSKIDQEVIDELVSMLEEHIAGGLKPKSEEQPMEPESEEIPGVESSEAPAQEDEDELQKLMELYGKE